MSQHDDHIWLTLDGGAWAIRKIDRAGSLVFHLWRGYEPNLEYATYFAEHFNQQAYADMAAGWLKHGISRL